MISIFEARTTEQTKNNFLIEKNNNFYLSFLKTYLLTFSLHFRTNSQENATSYT